MTKNQRIVYALFITMAIFATAVLLGGYVARTKEVKAADFLPLTQKTTAASSTVQTTSTQIIATSSSRIYASICNDSNYLLFLNFGNNAVLDKGIRVQSGACFVIDQDHLFRQAVNGIASSSALNVSYIDISGQQVFGN